LCLRLTREFLRAGALFRGLREMPGVERALTHRGIPLGPLAMAAIEDAFYRQFPWTIRSFLEVETVILHDEPDVLVLYAESSGLGRAAVAAARAHGIPSVAVQHGIMYPQYYSHEHAPDELERDPVPIPTRTAVFGELAKELLVRRGSYPEEKIVITGSPKFDALVKGASRYDPEGTRRSLGIPEGTRFLLLATRWTAVSPVFEELVRAIERLEGVLLFVKPHQAESPGPYRHVVESLSAARTRILSGDKSLLELLFASDGLITVDSFASSEALVLGRPVLVLNLPGNLGPLVDRGVALGVRRGESIAEALDRLLFDDDTARLLESKRKEYIQEFAFGADGRSTERIVECILNEGRERMTGHP
jgi:UDP-N-acetylglucosamine 2-epimerase